MSETKLPYNERNVVISEIELEAILSRFGLHAENADINIYRRAFVNKSYCTRRNENFVNGNMKCPHNCIPLQEESNERLEFFGDAVLSLVVGKYLFDRYPDSNEGFLTTMRTKIVNGIKLAELSRQIGLDKYVIISSQIEENNGRDNKNILEDVLEAFIGAIFIDYDLSRNDMNGYDACRVWIVAMIEELVDFAELIQSNVNYKDRLVKYCQHNHMFVPKYTSFNPPVDKNSEDIKRYHIAITDQNGNIIATGDDLTKKGAEHNASKNALSYYGTC
jgi:ribonuclease III